MWVNEYFERHQVVLALASIRSEWEEAVEGINLAEVSGSVGMLLADITRAIGLTVEEQAEVLGDSLIGKLQEDLIAVPVGNTRV